ncbi:MAG: heme A synthase [bacterium]
MLPHETGYPIWLHRFAKLVVAATFLLIFIGGLVTSTGSGLSVPDWPTTYGQSMFSFPLSKMIGGILYEHGHRMVATVVGFLTVILAIWIGYKEKRQWVKWLAFGALIAVIAQGILGGVTVLFLLPTSVSVLHGCLAQTFFCMTLCLAMFTSQEWLTAEGRNPNESAPRLQNWALLTTCLVFLQLILGAIMRHAGAGLAIPDFPLAFGKIIPPIKSQQVAIHFLHRIGALLVTFSVLATVYHVVRKHSNTPKLMRPALTLIAALVVQILLAGFTIWTKKAVLPTTAHVAAGAFILANSLFLYLRSRLLFGSAEASIEGDLIKQPTLS